MADLKVQRLSWGEGELADVLTIKFELIGKTEVVDCRKFPKAIYVPCDAARHGVGQRFGDLESGDKVGKAKHAAVKELRAHYEGGGDWRMSPDRDTTAVIFEALERLNSKWTKPVLEQILAKTPEKFVEWKSHSETKAMVAKIRAEKAAKAAKASTEKLDIAI